MICDKCNTEHNCKYCPECGTPADAAQQPAPQDKEQRFRRVVREEINSALDERKEKRDKARKERRAPQEKVDEFDYDPFG